MAHLPTIKRLLSTISVVVFLGCCFVVAIDAAPFVLSTQEPIGDEENYNSGVPYEFPDDYSISLEEAVATRKEFASAAILKMVTDIMAEIARGKKVRQEMMESIQDLQGQLRGQQVEEVGKMIQIPVNLTSQQVDNKRSESKEKRPETKVLQRPPTRWTFTQRILPRQGQSATTNGNCILPFQ